MKKLSIIGVITLLLVTSCTKDENNTSDNGSLLLLEVDYVTNTFQGGKEYKYSSAIQTDTVPVKASYISPCDFGELAISFEPFLNMPAVDTIFKGVIRWQHTGEVVVPQAFDPVNNFASTADLTNNTPSNSQFQVIYIDDHCMPASYAPIWSAIGDLSKTKEYYNPNKKIGIFLYTPGVGYPDDQVNKHQEEWRWFIIMYK